jgi:hypothetical protein
VHISSARARVWFKHPMSFPSTSDVAQRRAFGDRR